MALTPLQIDALLRRSESHECDGGDAGGVCVRIAAIADLPTRYGDFQVAAFWNSDNNKEHAALIHGDPVGATDVLVRLHSECLTGDVFGSLRCDCRDQLEAALRAVAGADAGIVLYLRQEGRGIGFQNKIRAYDLQGRGLDTVEANLALGFDDDEREYGFAAHALQLLEVRSVRLLTNNPRKIEGLAKHGVMITERVPLPIIPNDHNRSYLATKAGKSGHLIDLEEPVR
jgi:GTP cyclohydrolase II